MSGSISSSASLLSAAEKAASTSQSSTASSTTSSSSSSAAAASSSTSSSTAASSGLGSIASDFNSFLTLLTTQLQNQDPSSPMDSSQFTSEIAQFAGVQQQVDTNTNLGQLISVAQSGQLTSDNTLVGQTATFSGTQIPLQNGTAKLSFSTATAEPVAIAVTDSSGNVIKTVQETSSAGSNSWTWDGTDNSGNTVANGMYNVAVETQDASGNNSAVPFTMTGTVTGVTKGSNGDVMLQLGSGSVDMSTVTSVSQSSG